MTRFILIIHLVLLSLFVPALSEAETYTVSSTSDGGGFGFGTTLRELIETANGTIEDDVILVPPGEYFLSDENDELEIVDSATGGELTIRGTGPKAADVRIDGYDASYRIFNILSGANVMIENLTIANGWGFYGYVGTFGARSAEDGGGILNAGTLSLRDVVIRDCKAGDGAAPLDSGLLWSGGGPGLGGAIYNTGSLTLESCTIVDNAAGDGVIAGPINWVRGGDGGGIYHAGTFLEIVNSTFSGNRGGNGQFGGPGGSGGAIYSEVGTAIALNCVTISGNSSGNTSGNAVNGAPGGNGSGGGIFHRGTLALENSIVAGNISAAGSVNLHSVGTLDTSGANLLSGNPDLLPLAENGGPVPTMLPARTSAVVDAGNATAATPDADQRGLPRQLDGNFPPDGVATLDIGAVELANGPEAGVTDTTDGPGGDNLAEGPGSVSFGQIETGGSVTRTFELFNPASISLAGWSVTTGGSNSPDFIVENLSATTIASHGTATFSVRFTPSAPGLREGILVVDSAGFQGEAIEIDLSGIAGFPEIEVRDAEDSVLIDGISTIDFGPVRRGNQVSRTLTIHNTGTGALMDLVATIDDGSPGLNWPHSPEFDVGDVESTTLQPGESTNLTVSFYQTDSAINEATLQIASNDLDESPFDIALNATLDSNPAPNDLWSNATVLDTLPQEIYDTLHAATGEAGEPVPESDFYGPLPNFRSLWWRWEAPAEGILEFLPGIDQIVHEVFRTGGNLGEIVPIRGTGYFSENALPTDFQVEAGEIYDLRIAGDALAYPNFSARVKFTVGTPDPVLRGNGIRLSEGGSTPRFPDGSHFGSAEVGATRTRVFVLRNQGSASLSLNAPGVVLSGASAFSVISALPGGDGEIVLRPGEEWSFEVRFSPSGPVEHPATMTVLTSEGALNFALNGLGGILESTVSSATDGEAGSLRQLIQEAGSTEMTTCITIPAGQYELDSGPIGVESGGGTLILKGDGRLAADTVIDAKLLSRVFKIAAGTEVVLENLTVTGGQGKNGPDGFNAGSSGDFIGGNGESGGGIHSGGDVTLRNIVVINNFAGSGGDGYNGDFGSLPGPGGSGGHGGDGGGIYVGGGTMAIVNSTIYGNRDGIGGEGGPMAPDGSEGDGAGIHVAAGTLMMVNSTITGNVSNGRGGGIFNASELTAIHATIVENFAASGNGIFSDGDSTVVLENSIAPDGVAGAGTLSETGRNFLLGNPGLSDLSDNGGPTPTMIPLQFSPVIDLAISTDNSPESDQRGYPRLFDAGSDLGAVEKGVNDIPTFTITGNGIVIPNGDTTQDLVDGTDFGTATGTAVLERTFRVTNDGLLPIVFRDPKVFIIGSNDFTVSTNLPEALAVGESADFSIQFRADSLGRENSRVEIWTVGRTQTFLITASAVAGSYEITAGDPGSLRQAIRDAAINTAEVTLEIPAGNYPFTVGEALEVGSGQLNLIGQGETPGDTVLDADGLSRVLEIAVGADVVLENLTITGGRAPDGAGNGEPQELRSGGGILNAGSLTVRNVVVTGNRAGDAGSNDWGGKGGGIFSWGNSTLVVENSLIEQNESGQGASGQTGGHGGGVHVTTNATATFLDTTFSQNAAGEGGISGGQGGGGGAIASNSSNLLFDRCTFVDNAAGKGSDQSPGGSGGVILNTGIFTMLNSTLMGNMAGEGGLGAGAGGHGGGIENNGTATLRHCTLVGNRSGEGGEAIDNGPVGPSGKGGGLRLGFGQDDLYLENTIIAGNTDGSGAEDNLHNAGNGSVTETGVNFLSGDPILGDLADNGGLTQTMRPLVGSPVIDAAATTPDSPATDQRGFDRVIAALPDIGAVEAREFADLEVTDGETITLSWAPIDGALSYEVFRGTSGDPQAASELASLSAGTTSYTDDNTTPGTEYFYFVRYIDENGTSPFSVGVSGTRILPTPTISGTTAQRGGVLIDWPAADGATRYDLYRSNVNDSTQAQEIAMVSAGETSFLDDSGQTGQTYFYFLRYFNEVLSPFSQAVSSASLPVLEIVSQPTNKTVDVGRGTSLSVSANAGAGTPSYQWYRGIAGDTSSPLGTNSATLPISNLHYTTSYWVSVTDPYGSIQSVTATVTVDPVARRPLVEWQPVEGAEWYQIYINRNGSQWESIWLEGGEVRSWVPGDDLAHGKYDIWVRDWSNGGGLGEWVALPSIGLGLPEPIAPNGAQPDGEWQPEFSWEETTDADYYQLYIQRDGTLHAAHWIEGGENTTWQPEEDLPQGNYQFWVAPWSHALQLGAWSEGMEFSIGMPVPLGPGGAIDRTETRPEFTWESTSKNDWVQIYVQREGAFWGEKWVEAPATAWTFPTEASSGTYQWWIRSYNAADGVSSWVEGPEFTVAGVELLSPMGEVTATSRPTFQWEAEPGGVWYQLYVARGSEVIYFDWLEGATQWTPTANLEDGDYVWYVRAWSPAAGYLPWVGPQAFEVR